MNIEDILAVHEALLETPDAIEWVNAGQGAAQGRTNIAKLVAPLIDDAWSIAEASGWFDEPFDWEFCPVAVDHILGRFESPACIKPSDALWLAAVVCGESCTLPDLDRFLRLEIRAVLYAGEETRALYECEAVRADMLTVYGRDEQGLAHALFDLPANLEALALARSIVLRLTREHGYATPVRRVEPPHLGL